MRKCLRNLLLYDVDFSPTLAYNSVQFIALHTVQWLEAFTMGVRTTEEVSRSSKTALGMATARPIESKDSVSSAVT